ncbi:MAG TPA: acetyl-CoA carboxylase carboxyltransferase subunit alpha [Candidatus Sulfotelmatobacter sp.]|nr:acetyl-CoA carboxylase carboxyltransferase subunit alpha [Candidatus Sulfotelmatobacter sp.]
MKGHGFSPRRHGQKTDAPLGADLPTMAATEKVQQELEQIERQVAEMEAGETDDATRRQIAKLQDRIDTLRREMNTPPTAWQKTELARHPQRPQSLDYIERVFTDFSEIHGDRGFGDDAAIICGMARFHGEEVLVVGTQKGRDMKQRVFRNFGTPHPEGYRKAIRVMQVAEKFRRPIFTLVDTDGAYPGINAEERGQAEAIAYNLREMARLEVPIIATVIGVGGSGGALAIAVADRVLMMENSIYSVISPEGCAAIMWRDASKKELAAEAMRITATDLSELGCIDDIVPEPEGGAHRDHEAAANLLDASLQKHLADLKKIPPAELVASRYNKFRNIAQFFKTES